MNNLVHFPVSKKYEDRIKNVIFKLRKFSLIDAQSGLNREYLLIVLFNETKHKLKVSAFSNFFYKGKMRNRSIKTKEEYGKVIVLFLNYLFFDSYEKFHVKNIEDLTIKHGEKFLEDYANGLIGHEHKTRNTVELAEHKLNIFYRFLHSELKGMKYLSDNDFKSKGVAYNTFRNQSNDVNVSLFSVVYSDHAPPLRIQRISTELFMDILDICNKHYPHLKLMFCLQAFAGLRAGEVCNVSTDKIQYGFLGEEFSYFKIDLREKTRMRTDFKDTGGIKRRRIQAVHPTFLKYLKHVYDQHMILISGKDNPFGALFLNRNNEAMIEASYNDYFKRVIELLIKRLENRGDFVSIGQVNELRSARINKHIFRYFFTQHVAENVKTPNELASWRGDRSLDSSIVYLSQSKAIDGRLETIQDSVYRKFK